MRYKIISAIYLSLCLAFGKSDEIRIDGQDEAICDSQALLKLAAAAGGDRSNFSFLISARKNQIKKRYKNFKLTKIIDQNRPAHFNKFWRDNFLDLDESSDSENFEKDFLTNEIKKLFKFIWDEAVFLVKDDQQNKNSFENYFNKIICFAEKFKNFEKQVFEISGQLKSAEEAESSKLNISGINSLKSKITNLFSIRDKFWADKRSGRVLGKSPTTSVFGGNLPSTRPRPAAGPDPQSSMFGRPVLTESGPVTRQIGRMGQGMLRAPLGFRIGNRRALG